MIEAGLTPNSTIYTHLIDAFGRNGLLSYALLIFNRMMRERQSPSEFTYVILLGHLAAHHDVARAEAIFNTIDRNILRPSIYNVMIEMYVRKMEMQAASNMLEKMLAAGFSPNELT